MNEIEARPADPELTTDLFPTFYIAADVRTMRVVADLLAQRKVENWSPGVKRYIDYFVAEIEQWIEEVEDE